ncbi:MAG: hypothetical protein KatS3mg103_1379 [Phycisphaerales bacterium]|nr:MAG: hypothetical protein KatS3mg103_1379 [Phycisphaerales bacterium]
MSSDALPLPVHRDERGTPVLIVELRQEAPVVVLDRALLEALAATLDGLDLAGVAGVVVASGSEKAFVAGADLKGIRDLDDAGLHEYLRFGASVFARLHRLPVWTAAAIHGAALGGGLELAMHCDGLIGAPGRQALSRRAARGLAGHLPGLGGDEPAAGPHRPGAGHHPDRPGPDAGVSRGRRRGPVRPDRPGRRRAARPGRRLDPRPGPAPPSRRYPHAVDRSPARAGAPGPRAGPPDDRGPGRPARPRRAGRRAGRAGPRLGGGPGLRTRASGGPSARAAGTLGDRGVLQPQRRQIGRLLRRQGCRNAPRAEAAQAPSRRTAAPAAARPPGHAETVPLVSGTEAPASRGLSPMAWGLVWGGLAKGKDIGPGAFNNQAVSETRTSPGKRVTPRCFRLGRGGLGSRSVGPRAGRRTGRSAGSAQGLCAWALGVSSPGQERSHHRRGRPGMRSMDPWPT